MIRATHSASSAAAKGYYSTADYLAEGQELAGRVGGLLAERMGLSGRISKEQFDRLCDNLHPVSGERLTQRTKDDHQPGTDLTFTLGKGADAIRTLLRHAGIEAAFCSSVDDTMRLDVEPTARTRVRTDGRDEERVTGNMLWTGFDHFTARPVDGVPDFNRHRHVFVHNVTWDQEEGRPKALQRRDLKADAPYFEAAYHARQAVAFRSLGFELERVCDRYFDVAGVPQPLKNLFSRRTDLIETTATARGVTDPDRKAGLGRKTREKKAKNLTMDQLHAVWLARPTPKDLAQLEAVARAAEVRRLEGPAIELDGPHAEESVAHALDHLLERRSVVREIDVLAEALRHGLGYVTPSGVRDAFEARPDLLRKEIDGEAMVTTRAALAEERAVIAFARDGRATLRPLGDGDRETLDRDLDDGQRAAVLHVLRSADRATVIAGKAGSGKTRTLKEIAAAVAESGSALVPLAPTGESAHVLGEDFPEARTLQGFLLDERAQAEAAGKVWMLDEAGMVGMPLMRKFFDAADRTGSRVLLVGDSAQHAPVERGSPLKVLADYAGVKAAEIRTIKRQQTAEYREAAQMLAEGKVGAAFDALDSLGWVHELDANSRHATLAADYADATAPGKLKSADALVIAPTHAEGEALTESIRAELHGRGRLGESREFVRLKPLHMTEAQRRDARNYKPGLVAQFHQHGKGFKAGERVHVLDMTDGRVQISGKSEHDLLGQAPRFAVYREERIQVAPGDLIRLTARGKTEDGKQLTNGSMHTVAGFTPSGGIRLADGRSLAKDFGHFAHGYVLTSHASQSKTVQRAFVAIGPESYGAASKREFYVDATRARRRVDVYAEDKEALRGRLEKDAPRPAASEMAPTAREARAKELAERARRLRLRAVRRRRESERLDIRRVREEERQRGYAQ
ncbi:MobF family relaxase [Paludisphaera rhizosphaerae]|uniref:MobF family relaxase n=1 Tax=Paludisphaera rhizosphaerae TaxID=2711216 RepID=UPI0013EDEA23|nr:MobF family relaxase [Paludisphaera rhizosphaerae]